MKSNQANEEMHTHILQEPAALAAAREDTVHDEQEGMNDDKKRLNNREYQQHRHTPRQLTPPNKPIRRPFAHIDSRISITKKGHLLCYGPLVGWLFVNLFHQWFTLQTASYSPV